MKRYIKPEIEVMELEPEMMLVGSTDSLGFKGGDSPSKDNPDNVFAKGHVFSVWGDDEDEE